MLGGKKTDKEVERMTGAERRKYFGSMGNWLDTPETQVKDWSLMGKYNQAKAGDHFVRSASFAFGSGWSENALNSIGGVTKHQKNSMLMRTLIPLGTAYSAYDAISSGDSAQAFGIAGATFGALTGFRPFAEFGHGVGKKLGMGAGARLIGYPLGIAAGVAAAAIGYGALYGLATAGDSNSFIQKTAMTLNKGLMKSKGMEINNTLTARQRALGKLFRSALNDRGQLLGQEALIMRGVI